MCSVADALAVVGDRYSLLIVREIGYGYRRFQELAGFTGAPRDVLYVAPAPAREIGVVERRLARAPRAPRVPPHLGGRGFEPIVLALKEWGDRRCDEGEQPVVFAHACGAEFHPLTVCAACGEPVRSGELRVIGGTHPVEGEPW